MEMNARGTQRPWWVMSMSSGTTETDPTPNSSDCPVGKGSRDQASTMLEGGGKWGWDSQVGQKLESCWFLNKPYYSDPPSVAVYCVLPVTVQQRTHTGKRRAHAESSQLVISGHFGRATPFQISSWRTGCLLYFVPLWGYKQHTQVKRTTFHYAAQRSLLRVGVTNRTLACLFQHSWKDNTTADCIFPSPWEPATQRKLGGGTQG